MRALVFAMVLVGLAASAAGAVSNPPQSGLTVKLSSSKAHARPIVLSVRFDTSLQCGYARAFTISFPAASKVPAMIAAPSVHVGGKAAGQVAVSGHNVTITPARPTGPICDSIVIGPVTATFALAAGIGNPTKAGSYSLHVQRGATPGGATATGIFEITS